ncbi:Arginase/deacetylase [Hyaloscypha variabilis F]|uniref:Arginase/deacetylase n=1 Tax=Hyaloscypha variabilis (strain UAMH 11265 / GT02V1 / F) TaxID=1149755 RepID=A0A2J6S249_HYAVF|nr:Arginase/deacetylase [Hyaloscypha variabilis F]
MLPLLIFVASVCTAFASKQPQKVLDQDDRPANFIHSSIFGKHLTDNSLPAPVTLPPSYQSRDFDEEDAFGGIGTFAHLEYTECTNSENSGTFDIGIVGHPFDLGVSYRPGARFGPNGARQGARRISPAAGWDIDHGVNPFRNWATVTDCGDISNTPFDKLVAIQELEHGMKTINSMKPKNISASDAVRLITIGGDHTITLPILRALHGTWGRVAVLHFDSHLDTWDPKQLGGGLTKYSEVNHGTMLHIAHEEGLLSNHSNMHLGSRCALFDEHYDLNNDIRCGFSIIRARELDKLGVDKVVKKIVNTVGDEYLYLSVDIDVLDPAYAPATGTIEPGGWTTRELLAIINGLSDADLKIIGSDVVEFTPVYDNAAETTGIAVGQIIYEILQWMVKVPVKTPKA